MSKDDSMGWNQTSRMEHRLKNKPLKVKSKLKKQWIEVYSKDMNYWLGQYLMASMVVHAWDKKLGCPDYVGKIGDMKEEKDRSGTIPYQAKWVD